MSRFGWQVRVQCIFEEVKLVSRKTIFGYIDIHGQEGRWAADSNQTSNYTRHRKRTKYITKHNTIGR